MAVWTKFFTKLRFSLLIWFCKQLSRLVHAHYFAGKKFVSRFNIARKTREISSTHSGLGLRDTLRVNMECILVWFYTVLRENDCDDERWCAWSVTVTTTARHTRACDTGDTRQREKGRSGKDIAHWTCSASRHNGPSGTVHTSSSTRYSCS